MKGHTTSGVMLLCGPFVPFKDKRKVSQGGKQMRLNGETKTLKDPVALSDFLTQEGFSDKRIAVERNGETV